MRCDTEAPAPLPARPPWPAGRASAAWSTAAVIGVSAVLAAALLVLSIPPQSLFWATATHGAVRTRPRLATTVQVVRTGPATFAPPPRAPPAAAAPATPRRALPPPALGLLPAAAVGAAVVALGLLARAIMRMRSLLHPNEQTMVLAATGGEAGEDVEAPAGFVPPEPKKFTIPEGQGLRVAAAAIPGFLRLYNGLFAEGWSPSIAPDDDGRSYSIARFFGRRVVEASTLPTPRPAQPIQLWEYQGSPYCRKVREACCVLDLDVQFFPCPQRGPTYRPEAKGRGWPTFPHMVDPNTGAEMGESDDIVAYLFKTYGGGRAVPFLLSSNPFNTAMLYLAAVARYRPGSVYAPARQPKQPLELWAYEPAPFSVIAREALSELELPHIVHYCPRGSVHRDELIARAGTCQLPYLEDPNTGVKMFESTAIAEYLYTVYARK